MGWFEEICRHFMERARERHLAGHQDPWRIQGCGKLNRKGLAALREMWTWRDAEAKTWDKPAFMVCSNADLIQWSVALQEQRTVAPPPRFHAHRRSRFMNALQKFYLLDEEDYPCRPRIQRRQHSDQFEDNLARLCKLRDEKAEELGMEGSFLITRASLEAIAEDKEKGISTLLNWQRKPWVFKRFFATAKHPTGRAMAQKGLCPSSRTANTILIPEHPGFLKAFSAQGEPARDEHSSPANAVFPCLPIYIERKTVFSIMQGSSLPPCPPTAIHTWSWQSSASAPLPYAPSFPGRTGRKNRLAQQYAEFFHAADLEGKHAGTTESPA